MATIYKFGPFGLDTDAGILFRDTETTMLGQRAVSLNTDLATGSLRAGLLLSMFTVKDSFPRPFSPELHRRPEPEYH
jgi:hypothetical protein